MALDLTPEQIAVLESLVGRGFALVAFPLYASYLGVRKGNCAALLAPVPGGGFQLFGSAFYLVAGQPAVRVQQGDRSYFVFKKSRIEATAERDAELQEFREALSAALAGG